MKELNSGMEVLEDQIRDTVDKIKNISQESRFFKKMKWII